MRENILFATPPLNSANITPPISRTERITTPLDAPAPGRAPVGALHAQSAFRGHTGFSVFAGPPVEPAASASLESQTGYVTRPALAMDVQQKLEDGRLVLETPPDPRNGAILLALDPLGVDSPHHRPHPRSGTTWPLLGAYSNRAGIAVSSAHSDSAGPSANARAGQDNSDFSREACSSWARLLRKILEVDPLLSACGARMRIPPQVLSYFPPPPPISSCSPG